MARSNASVPVAFGIHNVSGDSHQYHWSITLVRSGKSQVEASGSVQTPAQGRTAISKSVPSGCTSTQVEVVVQLASPAESISFWVTCPSGAAKERAKQ
ncbi:MAG TPA: hypothetical protein VIZ43_16560 [Trebonia sp.]